MDADLDTLATALYVRVDDALKDDPELTPRRPRGSVQPEAVRRRADHPGRAASPGGVRVRDPLAAPRPTHLRHLFPYLPRQSGYNKRLRGASGQLKAMIRLLAVEPPSLDRRRVADRLHPGRVRPVPAHRQTLRLAGWSGYGYCASHSRYFWGLRLHLICTPAGLPIAYALTNPKTRRTRSRPRPASKPNPACSPPARARPSSPTRATPPPSSRSSSTDHGAHPAPRPTFRREQPAPAPGSSNPSARSSRPSTTPSKANSTSNATAAAPRRRRRPRPATHPRPHRRHLAQRPHRPTSPTIPHRLRPLTTPGINHLEPAPTT